jgi:hypothetical protein
MAAPNLSPTRGAFVSRVVVQFAGLVWVNIPPMAFLDKTTRIAVAVGLISGVAFVLINPKYVNWRLILLVVFGAALIEIFVESNWITQKEEKWSVVHGLDSSAPSRSTIRTTIAVIAAILLTVIFGAATWEIENPNSETRQPTHEREPWDRDRPVYIPVPDKPIAKPLLPVPKTPPPANSKPEESKPLASIRIASQKQVASADPEFPFGLEVVLVTDTDVSPTSLIIKFSGEIGKLYGHAPGTIYTESQGGIIANTPDSILIEWRTPAFSVTEPVVLTIYSRAYITAEKIESVPFTFPYPEQLR